MEWTGARYADEPEVTADTWIAAPPERVWPLVSELERMPARSTELEALTWLSDGPGPGARFVGHNQHPSLGSWSVEGTVVEWDAPSRLPEGPGQVRVAPTPSGRERPRDVIDRRTPCVRSSPCLARSAVGAACTRTCQ